MKGNETMLLAYMEGKDKRYIIPVYQRRYNWRLENCQQLFDDLKKTIKNNKEHHFFGSLVSQVLPNGAIIDYHIIDGQQRLTTVSLLLLAICHLVKKGLVQSNAGNLDDEIMESYLISKWAKKEDRIKLRPVKEDREAYAKLIDGEPKDFIQSSNLTINYNFFRDQILKKEISVDDLYAAIKKLQIISVTLENGDDPQLIFESLNSTGLALTEGDKIRNYILMGLDPDTQEDYYDNYWVKIENCTGGNVSDFIRDYLSIKQQVTPVIDKVYQAFKKYAEDINIAIKDLLTDLLKYARYFEKLRTGHSGLGDGVLDSCMDRLNRLQIIVTRPFFMEVLKLQEDGALSVDNVRDIFTITETYLFRRNICEVPTNALNKIFLNLNKDVIRFDKSTDNYVEKFKYALLAKKESGRFPDDEEFSKDLADKEVYQMRGRYKNYLFERFENYDTVEVKDVYKLLDEGTYSIEHVMPQTLTPWWTDELGEEAEEVHETWLHRLGNLTLTGYNSSMSNSSFPEKRDAPKGFNNSGLRLNAAIAKCDQWTAKEIENRNEEMVDKAANVIWPMPVTTYKPAEKELDSYSLDDESANFTGRDIVKYSFQNVETKVSSWTDMYEHIIKFLHSKDKSVLSSLALSTSQNTDLGNYFSNDQSKLRETIKVDDQIYAEKNSSTTLKISVLKKLFPMYGFDPSDITFYLKDPTDNKKSDSTTDIREQYWEYALPIIRKANAYRGCFANVNPTRFSWVSGWFGIGGFNITCSMTARNATVTFTMRKKNVSKNNEAFDILYQHKDEIEKQLGVSLKWDNKESTKGCFISYVTEDANLKYRDKWGAMADFHAKWSHRLCDVLLPYLKPIYPDAKA